MVIHDGDVGRTGMCPAEHDAPLIIDSDRVKAGEVPLKRLEPVAGRYAQVEKDLGCVEHVELAQGNSTDVGRDSPGQAPRLSVIERLRGTIGERDDHRRQGSRYMDAVQPGTASGSPEVRDG